ncbi:MAG TPA: M23 family metallopeptidase [Chloroflexota bacterium]|nr:M23 family metallopeptidase [Chloroflexota bacterium]
MILDRDRTLARPLVAALLLAVLLTLEMSQPGFAAGTPTPGASPPPTVQPTPTVAPTPTELPPTATATATAVPRVEASPTPERRARRHHRKRASTPMPQRATATPTAAPHHRRHRNRRTTRHGRKQPTATPSPTPILNVTADNSITPVTCNGPGKPAASHPFLTPPFRGWTSLGSYFDHDSPNFSQDGVIITANGMEGHVDPTHRRYDFPAYWDAGVRQYLYYDGHNGYDYNVSYQPIYAAAPGKVIFAAWEYPTLPTEGYGQMVMIEHAGGYVTLYGHFSKIVVRAGQRVKRGQRIGTSGDTGHSTGPHLHFTVFHNCTPTDPYGWSGSGPDPLQSYQGESSEYLWVHQPLIVNPPPGWPGADHLPAGPGVQLLLLKLPGRQRSAAAFNRALKAEASELRSRLGLDPSEARLDPQIGALDVSAPISPATVYRAPQVASIATLDTLAGQHADVLAALAAAAMQQPHHSIRLTQSAAWTGFFLRWAGHVLLIGKGVKGAQLQLRLSPGRGGSIVRWVQTDPSTGSYVVDLGKLPGSAVSQLEHRVHATSRRLPVRSAQRPAASESTRRGQPDAAPFIGVGLAALLGCAALLFAARNRRLRIAGRFAADSESAGE